MKIAKPTSTLIDTPGLPTITSRVDPEGARRIMEMLVNLYADQRLAVVREYVSNAVDATRDAGSVEPVAITTPTMLEPNLTITDKGTGMTAAEVEATFLAFAASTKRDSNEMIGGLGVGAKSAWTLAESFLVDTVKDKQRTIVRAARNLEHQVIMADAPTDMPNGTTIVIPVEVAGHTDAWKRVIHEVASAHDEGAVLVDGEPVESLAGGPWIGPIAPRRVERPDRSSVVVRSGGTLFSSVSEITSQVLNKTGLRWAVIELPIGSFDHTPSRESVIATDRTKAAVNKALEEYQLAYDALARKVEDLAATDIAAATRLRTATLNGAGREDMLPIPFKVATPPGSWNISHDHRRARWDRIEIEGSDTFRVTQAEYALSRAMVVTGVPLNKKVSGFIKFLNDKHPDVTRVISTSGDSISLPILRADSTPTNQTWQVDLNKVAVHYTYTDLTTELANRRTKRGITSDYTCKVIDQDDAQPRQASMSAAEIAATGLPVIYVHETLQSYTHMRSGPASVWVYLGRRKVEPLLAAVPWAISRQEWQQKRIAAATVGWSEAEFLAASYLSNPYRYKPFRVATAALPAISTDHPTRPVLEQIAAIVRSADKVKKKVATLPPIGAENHKTLDKLRNTLISAYPLLESVSYYEDVNQHQIDYVVYTPPRKGREEVK